MAKKSTSKATTKGKTQTGRKPAATAESGPAAGKRFYRILSLDGGGIRGIITATWLHQLERELRRPIKDAFDIIAGTSTGGILACAVSAGMSPAEIIKLYQERGRAIFPAPASRLWNRFTRTLTQGPSAPKYDDAGLKNELQSVFGDMTFGELHIKPTLITSYNVLTRDAKVFKNTRAAQQQLPVWEIAKATASAPTYFPAHVMSLDGADAPLVDGGVVANNPTACAIAECVRCNGDGGTGSGLEDFVVVSMGTGHTTRSISINEAREWGALEWAVPVIDVLMDGAADATDYIATQLIAKDRYFRFQTRLDEAYDDMDNADATNINALLNLAHRHLDSEGGKEQLAAAAKLL